MNAVNTYAPWLLSAITIKEAKVNRTMHRAIKSASRAA